ncbi:DNA-processing protein DprA [Jeotgalibacillus haloalkalitolerans]|uniref:DNA-processing protein DprA n=1 Tax=Jeotgalibacillus haloalkalitolerans TaxID=3104292 RepID=A0ABU5KKL7_9BACL|nr:DNA-processing protein DprA [Jeotgalibacillus sp. HH7-29]MDZ5711707.1 DNA-processing protein DprA [Jeotgalibacillus sp. HH7-29]
MIIEQRDQKLLYLHYMNVLTNKQLLLWLRADPFLERPLSSPPPSIKLTPHQNHKLTSYISATTQNEIFSHMTAAYTSYITIFHELYPEPLREIYDPPVLLYTKGNTEYLAVPNQLAVIGSRKADLYTRTVLQSIIPELLSKDIGIISGMAKGADGIAHEIALHGRTIGVTGSGFQHQYPASNHTLYRQMEHSQLLISEYPPYVKPQKHHFPMRNRIIAGCSRGLLITQAEAKSGTMITVDRALEEGRDVFAVPGPAGHPLSEGTNLLIGQGARCTVCAADILNEWNLI